jgi:hypothetical protein
MAYHSGLIVRRSVAFALVNFDTDTNHPVRPAFRSSGDHAATLQHPEPFVLKCECAVFGFEIGITALAQLGQPRAKVGRVVRVNLAAPALAVTRADTRIKLLRMAPGFVD